MSDSDLEEIKLDFDCYNQKDNSFSDSSDNEKFNLQERTRLQRGETHPGDKLEIPEIDVVKKKYFLNSGNLTNKIQTVESHSQAATQRRRLNKSAPSQKAWQSYGTQSRIISSANYNYSSAFSKNYVKNYINEDCSVTDYTETTPVNTFSAKSIFSCNDTLSTSSSGQEQFPSPQDYSRENVVKTLDKKFDCKQQHCSELSHKSTTSAEKIKKEINIPNNAYSHTLEEIVDTVKSLETKESEVEHEITKRINLKADKDCLDKEKGHVMTNIHYHKQVENSNNEPIVLTHRATQTVGTISTSSFDVSSNRPISSSWFMLHKSTNTSSFALNHLVTSSELSNERKKNFLFLKSSGNNKRIPCGTVTSPNGSSACYKNNFNGLLRTQDSKNTPQLSKKDCFCSLFSCCF